MLPKEALTKEEKELLGSTTIQLSKAFMKNIIDTRSSFEEFLQQAVANSHAVLGSVDLRGQDLNGLRCDFVSLGLAQFDGANLSQAQFNYVDLTNASFRGAKLDGASFRFVRGGAVNWNNVQAEDAQWDRSSLVESNFAAADLQRSRFVYSGLEKASFDDADLMLGSFTWSNLDYATFRNTNLDQTETIGASLTGADFSSARNFAYCREIVMEILARDLDQDLATMKWLGAVTLLRKWCYPVWAKLLKKDDPNYFIKAMEIFQKYPTSGCLEAFLGNKYLYNQTGGQIVQKENAK